MNTSVHQSRWPGIAPIIGASRSDQLDASLAAAELDLDDDLKRQLDELTHEYRMGDAPR